MTKPKSKKVISDEASLSDSPPRDAPASGALQTPEVDEILSVVADMAAGAAHEINNPLAVISGRSQLMREKATTEKEQKVWDVIISQAQQISDIITDLMKFASPPPPDPEPIEMGLLIKNALFYFSSPNNLNNQAVKNDKDIEKGLPCVWADRAQIVAVIQELILNAINAAESEPYISIKAMAASGGKQVHLMIRDNGPGMDAKTLASAFTPFFSTQRAGRRRGLGLPMAWRYVVNNHGRIWIESQPGEGTTAYVALPAARS